MVETSSWQKKLILLFKSEKTYGAKKIHQNYAQSGFEQLKQRIITEKDIDFIAFPDKPRIKDLSQHLNKIKNEFVGKSELEFYHATLVVLIRRGYDLEKTFNDFEQLWQQESDFLLNKLSLRWIVSACDTFVDHSTNPSRAAILMNVVSLVNCLKVYETHHYLLQHNENSKSLNDAHIQSLYQQHLPLYDGLSYFRIGTDDTLKNMRQRYASFYNTDKLATDMLLFVFDKLQNNPTAFATMRSLHKDPKSSWWQDS